LAAASVTAADLRKRKDLAKVEAVLRTDKRIITPVNNAEHFLFALDAGKPDDH
jgi:short-subunit dehydrogenase